MEVTQQDPLHLGVCRGFWSVGEWKAFHLHIRLVIKKIGDESWDNVVQTKYIHFHDNEEEEQTEEDDVENADARVPQHVSELQLGPNCSRKASAVWTACVFS